MVVRGYRWGGDGCVGLSVGGGGFIKIIAGWEKWSVNPPLQNGGYYDNKFIRNTFLLSNLILILLEL